MNQDLKNKALSIFERSAIERLYVNNKGEFFSTHLLAINSVKNESDIKEITKKDCLKIDKKQSKKLVLTASDSTKICFVELAEGDIPKIGDKAKIGSKNANGVFKMTSELSYEFNKGLLTKNLENN
jgi:hypothetical protein